MNDQKQYRVPFGKLVIGDTTRRLIAECLDRNWVSAGPLVERFESLFAVQFGFKHAVAVSSGTSAVMACLLAAKEEISHRGFRGDKVIVPALCFPAPVNAAMSAGYSPVFVDIDRRTLYVNPTSVGHNLYRDGADLQIVVHNMGRPSLVGNFSNAIEDACEAHGSSRDNRKVGTDSIAAAFSFYAAHMICSGEGGMACTNDDNVADTLRSVRSHGRPAGSLAFDFQRFGLNLKMTDLQAAVGIEGLEQFPATFARRREVLQLFWKRLRPLRGHFYTYHFDLTGCVTAPHAVPLVVREDAPFTRDAIMQRLEERGVQCKTLFGCLPTQHPAFAWCNHKLGDFPEAEFVGNNGFHFGCHQYITDEDVDYVVGVIEEFVLEHARNEL